MALRIVDEMITLGVEVHRLCKQIALRDKELASQTRRAWTRAIMNAGEAQHRRGAKGVNRFDDAMGEAREAHTGLRAGRTFEYIGGPRCDEVFDQVDRAVATLYKRAHRRPH